MALPTSSNRCRIHARIVPLRTPGTGYVVPSPGRVSDIVATGIGNNGSRAEQLTSTMACTSCPRASASEPSVPQCCLNASTRAARPALCNSAPLQMNFSAFEGSMPRYARYDRSQARTWVGDASRLGHVVIIYCRVGGGKLRSAPCGMFRQLRGPAGRVLISNIARVNTLVTDALSSCSS